MPRPKETRSRRARARPPSTFPLRSMSSRAGPSLGSLCRDFRRPPRCGSPLMPPSRLGSVESRGRSSRPAQPSPCPRALELALASTGRFAEAHLPPWSRVALALHLTPAPLASPRPAPAPDLAAEVRADSIPAVSNTAPAADAPEAPNAVATNDGFDEGEDGDMVDDTLPAGADLGAAAADPSVRATALDPPTPPSRLKARHHPHHRSASGSGAPAASAVVAAAASPTASPTATDTLPGNERATADKVRPKDRSVRRARKARVAEIQ